VDAWNPVYIMLLPVVPKVWPHSTTVTLSFSVSFSVTYFVSLLLCCGPINTQNKGHSSKSVVIPWQQSW
jgi:hypothetical protein